MIRDSGHSTNTSNAGNTWLGLQYEDTGNIPSALLADPNLSHNDGYKASPQHFRIAARSVPSQPRLSRVGGNSGSKCLMGDLHRPRIAVTTRK